MNHEIRPVVAFLIPFASRRIKSRWDLACSHLRQALNSIKNSSSANYSVVVAGHEPPDFAVETHNISFLSVNHEMPPHEDPVVRGRLDKLAKIAAAWRYVKSRWDPVYVMKLDADDLISSRLVEWLQHAARNPGYLIQHGWMWRSGARYFFQCTEYFDRVCASCLIIRSDIADQEGPFLTQVEGAQFNSISVNFAMADHKSLVPGSDMSTLLLNDSHQRYAAQFAYLGHKLFRVPFKAVAYRIGNLESNSAGLGTASPTLRMVLGRIRRTRVMTKSLRSEFALE